MIQESQHPDDLAIDAFAAKMKAKLAAKRAQGRGGWADKTVCSNQALSQMLREHVEKGDPVDVANFAMMICQRGERIASPGNRMNAFTSLVPAGLSSLLLLHLGWRMIGQGKRSTMQIKDVPGVGGHSDDRFFRSLQNGHSVPETLTDPSFASDQAKEIEILYAEIPILRMQVSADEAYGLICLAIAVPAEHRQAARKHLMDCPLLSGDNVDNMAISMAGPLMKMMPIEMLNTLL